MEEQLRARLAQLDEEFEKGQEMLHAAELQQRQLTETLLRISGARQVLLELLGEAEAESEPTPPGNGLPAEPERASGPLVDEAAALKRSSARAEGVTSG